MASHLETLPVSRDVILYSFPKCGRTWLRYMYMYLYGEHLAATHLVASTGRSKHIVLVRRFEDALVSYYFEVVNRAGFGEIDTDGAMTRTWVQARRGGMLALLRVLNKLPLDHRYRKLIAAAMKERSLMVLFRICVDAFFERYRLWLAQPGCKLVLRYEDLKADPVAQLRGLTDFVGVPPVVGFAQAVEAASFENMRQLELSGQGTRGILRDGYWLPNLTTSDSHNPEALKTREGKVGGHRAHLSEANLRLIDAYIAARHAEVAAAYGYYYGAGVSDGTGTGRRCNE
jgi:hypothetical protein